MDFVTRDLRGALRTLARRPGFAAVAVLTFGLGVGASTAMFSVLYGVVLHPLPYPDPERIARLYPVDPDGRRAPWAAANFIDLKAQATSYEALAGYQLAEYSTREDAFPTRLTGATVTPEFFQVFAVTPILGRVLSPTTDAPGGERAAVIGHGMWQSRFASDPAVVGRSLELNGEPYTIVGVMPAGFAFPGGVQLWTASRYRVPETSRDLGADPAENRDNRYFHAIARLREGVSPGQAAREGEAIADRLAKAYPDSNPGLGFALAGLHGELVDSVRPMLLALFGAVVLVLLIACANVANLLLARAAGRTHEIAIRTAIGAGRGSIARQLLTESVLLGLCGGAVGAALAVAGTDALLSLAASELPRAAEVEISLPVLGFTLAVSLLSGLLFGLAPVLWLVRGDPATALREAGGRTAAGAVHGRIRRALVAAEIALSLTLLVGAGLLVRTLAVLGTVDPGFSERNALTAQIWLPGSRTLSDDELRAFQGEVLERARALPGVTSAGAVLGIPVDWGVQAMATYTVEGKVVERSAQRTAGLQGASPGYFETIGIPLRAGRAFTAADGPDSPPVMVVSEAFAERFMPGEDPVGKRVGLGHPEDEDFEWLTVVGVVGSTRHDGLDAGPRAEAYLPLAQTPWAFMSLVLKTSVEPSTLAEPLRRAVMAVRGDQPVDRIVTLAQVLHESLARRRFNMLLLGLFAGLALLLAAVGLFGVMSFSVAQRTREIGIRMAVGARPADILRLVLGEGGRLIAVGLLLGTAASLAAGRLIAGLLYQVPPADPPAFAAAAATLTLVALLAAWLPARRAVRIDPAGSLRNEQ